MTFLGGGGVSGGLFPRGNFENLKFPMAQDGRFPAFLVSKISAK